MVEFVFKKSALTKLIQQSGDPETGNVVVRLAFEHGTNGAFLAKVSARCEGGKTKVKSVSVAAESLDEAIDGCPRPPGCHE